MHLFVYIYHTTLKKYKKKKKNLLPLFLLFFSSFTVLSNQPYIYRPLHKIWLLIFVLVNLHSHFSGSQPNSDQNTKPLTFIFNTALPFKIVHTGPSQQSNLPKMVVYFRSPIKPLNIHTLAPSVHRCRRRTASSRAARSLSTSWWSTPTTTRPRSARCRTAWKSSPTCSRGRRCCR